MKLTHIASLALLGLITLPVLAAAPAHACTPHPDYPGGCDGPLGMPGRPQAQRPTGLKPIPDPVCLSCPPHSLKLNNDQLRTPIQTQPRQVMPHFNPGSLGPLTR